MAEAEIPEKFVKGGCNFKKSKNVVGSGSYQYSVHIEMRVQMVIGCREVKEKEPFGLKM